MCGRMDASKDPDDEGREKRTVRGEDYRLARIGAAAALTVVLCTLLLLDVLVPSYDVQPVTLIVVLGAVIALLGLEAADFLRFRGP